MQDLTTLMDSHKGFETIKAKTSEEWRQWLHNNHDREGSVWLVVYKKGCGVESIQHADARDEAICYGWIDSQPSERDDVSYFLFFSPRSPKSPWSQESRERAEKLTRQGRMATAGLDSVRVAKSNGSWIARNDVTQLTVLQDAQ